MAKTPKSPRQFIFIDDSGDPGISLTKGASRYFIISAISFSSQNDLELATQEISNLRKRLHWQPEREFKFHRASGNVKTKFFDIIRSFNFNASITVVDKSEVKSLPSDLYNHTILKSLLNLPISYANIYIDGKSGKSYQKKIRVYFRQNLPKNSVHTLKYIDSKSSSLIQLADMISGATMEYYTTKRQQYLAQIYDKLNFSS